MLPEWRPPDAVVAAISLKDAAEILNKVDDFNEEMSARPPFLFKGGSNDLINKTEPQLRASVLTPICRMIEQISGDSMNNGVAAINIQPYAWVIESFGIMKVAIISANNIDCQPGRCDFSVRVHCRTQAGALREACRGINSGLSTMFGESNGVPVSVTFRPNGEVESLSASMR